MRARARWLDGSRAAAVRSRLLANPAGRCSRGTDDVATHARLGGHMGSRTIDVQTRQRVEALASANRVRLARAELKRRVADGDVSAAEVILLHPTEVERMPVADLLISQRHWGDVRCRRLLIAVGLPES